MYLTFAVSRFTKRHLDVTDEWRPWYDNVDTLWSYRPLWSLKLIRFSQKWLWYPQIRISLLPYSTLCKRLKWLIVKCFVFFIFISFVQLTKFHFCSWVCYGNNNNQLSNILDLEEFWKKYVIDKSDLLQLAKPKENSKPILILTGYD